MIKRMIQRWLGLVERDPQGGVMVWSGALSGTSQISPERECEEIRNQEGGLHFTVYPAQGGRVVQVRSYDERKDHTHSSLHIITSDEDFGEQINQIYMQEQLTRGAYVSK